MQGEVRIWRTVHRNSLVFQDGTLQNDLSETGSTQRDPVDQWAKEKLDGVHDAENGGVQRKGNTLEQELICRSVDQFFGEFAMVTDDTPRSANVTALTHVKLVCINKHSYMKLNRECDNSFESIFAPHKRDTHGDGVHHHHVPKNNSAGKSQAWKFLKNRVVTNDKAKNLF